MRFISCLWAFSIFNTNRKANMSEETKPNPVEAFQRLLEKNNNDGIKLASQLFDENYQYRTQLRDLKEKQPKDGSLVLSQDEAKQWNLFKELGDPKEIKKSLDKMPELEKTNKELAGMENLRELADLGLEGSKLKLSVLKDQLAKYPDAQFTFKTEKDKDGVEAKVAYIKSNAESQETPFSQFATENLADYLPSLKVSPEAQPPIPGNTGDPKPHGDTKTGFFDRIRESVKSEKPKPMDIDAAFGRPTTV
jgi:hypothetical protein